MIRWTLPICLLVLAACGGPDRTEDVVAQWPDGSRKEVRSTEESVAGEEVQQFHENGRIHVRGRLVEGVREGTWNTYRDNGNPGAKWTTCRA